MLSTVEKILYILLAMTSLGLASVAFFQMARVILRGQGRLSAAPFARRLAKGLLGFLTQGGMLTRRPLTSAIHSVIVLRFVYYLLANVGDLAEGFLPEFRSLADTEFGRRELRGTWEQGVLQRRSGEAVRKRVSLLRDCERECRGFEFRAGRKQISDDWVSALSPRFEKRVQVIWREV